MATVSKALFRGAASTGSTTLYTVPSATTAIVTNIVVCNETNAERTFRLALNGISIAFDTPVAANSVVILDMKQPLSAGQTITGQASSTSVDFHIAGVEVS